VLTTSTSESYSFLFRLLCDPGDEVLVAQPSYPLFDFLADLDDVRLKPYPLFYDHGWWIDMAELERAIGPRTRAVIVVHPNNPTGHWTGTKEREALEGLCARRGMALIVDEVFLDYPLREAVPEAVDRGDLPAWSGEEHVPGAKAQVDSSAVMPGLKSRPISEPGSEHIAQSPDFGHVAQSSFPADAGARSFACGEHPALTFVLSGLSKIAGLPQMKAAWIATLGPEGAKAEALGRLEIVADTFLSMTAPVQLAMGKWLAGAGAIQEQIRERARGNLATLRRMEREAPGRLQVLEVEAGWSAVVGLPGCVGDRDCAERLVRERGVVVHPGGFYGMAEGNRVVVSLIGPAGEFEAGMRCAIDEVSTGGKVDVVDEPK